MARAYQTYVKKFGAKGFEHPDVNFVTSSGTKVVMIWEKAEYRAYKRSKDGSLLDMRLGGVVPENLKEYIVKNF